MISLQKDDVFVIGDLSTKDSQADLTFTVMSKFPNVIPKTFQELTEKSSIVASDAPVLMCFPYSLWDKMVETGDKLYGVGNFGKSIRDLAEHLTELLDKRFPNALYVNHPKSILIERDKLKTKEILHKKGLRVAEDILKHLDSVMNELEAGNSIYIKVRYGSMGKGITYLSPKKWTTNFKYDGKNITNHENDHEWREIDITGDKDFLKKILDEDVVVERAIRNPLTNGFKFDLRAYSLFGEADPRFAYGRITNNNSITNLSQKGSERKSAEEMLKYIPEVKMKQALELINESSKILGFNYAGGDVLFEGEDFEPVFLEINSFPGYSKGNAHILFPKLEESIRKNLSKIHYEMLDN